MPKRSISPTLNTNDSKSQKDSAGNKMPNANPMVKSKKSNNLLADHTNSTNNSEENYPVSDNQELDITIIGLYLEDLKFI